MTNDYKDTTSNEFVNDEKKLEPETIKAIQGGDINNQEWVDRGIVDVPVADIPMPEDVTSPEDFNHHISWENAKSATEQLPQIQEAVKSGKCRDDFWSEDQKNGMDWAHGKERVYDLFYGNDPIKLDKEGDHYDIVSGRHRIYAAKALGLETIPARLHEKLGG